MNEQVLELFKKSSPIFLMLQDKKRQEILLMLCEEGKLSVNQITNKLDLSRPATSHHLKLLFDVGLLSVEKNGTERFYEVQLADALSTLRDLLESLEIVVSKKNK